MLATVKITGYKEPHLISQNNYEVDCICIPFKGTES